MIKRIFLVPGIFFCVGITCAQTVDKEKITEYFQNQQFEDAIGYLLPVYARDSTDLPVLGFLGYAYYMNDAREKAKYFFRKILLADSNNISANQYLANIEISQNNNDSAKPFIHRLIQISPGRASYYRIMGSIFQADQQNDSALIYFDRAYRLSPLENKNVVAYTESLISDSNYRKADSILYSALSIDSMNIPCLKLLIQSSYASKNYQGILSPGEKLIELGELSVKVLPKLIFAYYTLNRYPDCIRVCQVSEANSLAGESTYYYEARSWAALDSPALSNQLLEKCLGYSISRTSELYYYTLARNYESMKKYDRAKTCYDTAYYLFRNPLILYYCGQMFDNADRYKSAKKFYRKFLQVCHPVSAEEKRYYRYAQNRKKEIH